MGRARLELAIGVLRERQASIALPDPYFQSPKGHFFAKIKHGSSVVFVVSLFSVRKSTPLTGLLALAHFLGPLLALDARAGDALLEETVRRVLCTALYRVNLSLRYRVQPTEYFTYHNSIPCKEQIENTSSIVSSICTIRIKSVYYSHN